MRLYDGKTIEEAFPHVLKSQLESRLKKLEASRQAMLRERSGYIANIQKGADLVWEEMSCEFEVFSFQEEKEEFEPPRREERQGKRYNAPLPKLISLGGLAVNHVRGHEG